jgi:outer membrane beta-barrel protein
VDTDLMWTSDLGPRTSARAEIGCVAVIAMLVLAARVASADGDAATTTPPASGDTPPAAKQVATSNSETPAAAKQVAASDETPASTRTTDMCIDQAIADRLAVKRKRRGAVDRLFVKAGRHEISFDGGYYVSDLLSGTYVVGGSYTYHMTEDTGIEFSGWYTHANADLIQALEGQGTSVLANTFADEYFVESVLQWSPVYGKLRAGGTILHFDLHGDLGAGVVSSGTSRGADGVIGFGLRIFLSQAFALRIDARDRTFRQEVLGETFLVNDVSLTAGISLFLPPHN